MKSITGHLDNKYSEAQNFSKMYSTMDHIDSSRSVEYQAIGSNSYSARDGAKVVKFRLSDDRAWLDPSSVRIQYKITNTTTAEAEKIEYLYPLKAHGFFTRLRLMTRSSLIEDVSDYNRVHEMFQTLKPDNVVKSEVIEGFKNLPGVHIPVQSAEYNPHSYFTSVSKGESMVVSFKPFSGLLSQSHYIPLSFLPLEIELELSTDNTANIVDKASAHRAAGTETWPPGFDVSESWSLSDFKILCDQKYYSPKFYKDFVDMMTRENGSYKIPINNYTSIYQTLFKGPIDINISKSVHSLDRVYVSFFQSDKTRIPFQLKYQSYLKPFNFFYSPAVVGITTTLYNPTNDIKRLGLRIGSLNFPDTPLQSNSVCYHYLSKVHPETSIAVDEYYLTKFISVFDLERAGASSDVLARGIDTNNKNLRLSVEWPPTYHSARIHRQSRQITYIL